MPSQIVFATPRCALGARMEAWLGSTSLAGVWRSPKLQSAPPQAGLVGQWWPDIPQRFWWSWQLLNFEEVGIAIDELAME